VVVLLEGHCGKLFFARLQEDDDVAESVKKKAEDSGVKAGMFMLIGALKCAELGCYKEGEYVTTRLDGPLEVASCMGNIAIDEKGGTIVHGHIVISNENGEAYGGHLMRGCLVGPTAELVVVEAAGVGLQRRYDEKTKLKLLKLG
jgi:predicted DNA-binding protein with PD1-like motif